MIFRGDGRNNLNEGNCFTFRMPKEVTKVLMNPPFALKKDDEREYKFVDYALSQMEDGGELFTIIPSTIMFKGGPSRKWRGTMLSRHTLKAVVKFPEDLFYPIGVHSSGIIIKKGIPHEKEGDVFWGKLDDGFRKKKRVMLKFTEGNMDYISSLLRDFIRGSKHLPRSKPREHILTPILFDNDLECAPEYYLEENKKIDSEINNGIYNILSNLYNFLFNNPHLSDRIDVVLHHKTFDENESRLDSLFNILNAQSSNIEDYSEGVVPFVTSTELNNGVESFIEPDEKSMVFEKSCITVSSFGFATVQLPHFVARSHGAVIVLVPRVDMGLLDLAFFAAQINLLSWRFSYGRWVTKKRLLKLAIKAMSAYKIDEFRQFEKKIKKKATIVQESLFIS